MCAQCQSLDWEPFVCSGQGAIYSYVVFHHPQLEGYKAPYIVAVIELKEGVRMVSNVVGINPAEVLIGMQVHVAFEDVGGGVVLPVFRPI